MTRLLLILPLLALATAAVAAEPEDKAAAEARVGAAFGNTVMSIYPDGRSQKIWLEPDGKWTGLSRRGNPLSGSWSMKGEKVCLKQSKPPTLPISFCQAFPSDPVKGVDAKDLTGTPIHLKLVKGHVEKSEG
jgi:hypothetical protein